ncbi:MAG: flagellar protein FlaG [Thermodesulfobacteriota bacterium]|nr:flagellar protein FlaG [Thermodesulfobacteriota bacterium]
MNINNINAQAAPPEAVSVTTTFTPSAAQVKSDTVENLDKIQKTQTLQNQTKTKAKAKEQEEKPSSTEEMQELTEELNEYMDDLQTNLGFYVKEDKKHQIIVEIKNRKTDELVKQIPSEELLTIKEKMEELTGLIFDAKV